MATCGSLSNSGFPRIARTGGRRGASITERGYPGSPGKTRVVPPDRYSLSRRIPSSTAASYAGSLTPVARCVQKSRNCVSSPMPMSKSSHLGVSAIECQAQMAKARRMVLASIADLLEVKHRVNGIESSPCAGMIPCGEICDRFF